MLVFILVFMLALTTTSHANDYAPVGYGLDYGDTALPRADDNAYFVPLTFKLWDQDITGYWIGTNGVITTSRFTSFNPSESFSSLIDNSIYPFFFDMTFSSSRCGADCNLFYRVNPDQQTLNNIAELVEKTYEIDGVTGFTPLGEETSVFTWSKVPKFSFGGSGPELNTVQVILTSDGNKYYVIIAFIEMQYPEFSSSPSPKIGIRYNGTRYCQIPWNTYCRSNVYTPGVYVIDVTFKSNALMCQGTAEDVSIGEIMKFVCGTFSIPNLGPPGKLKVLFKHWCANSNRICKCKPTISTCTLSLTLPVYYFNKQTMKETLRDVARISQGFNK